MHLRVLRPSSYVLAGSGISVTIESDAEPFWLNVQEADTDNEEMLSEHHMGKQCPGVLSEETI